MSLKSIFGFLSPRRAGDVASEFRAPRVAAPGLLGFFQDDWMTAGLILATLVLAVWTPPVTGTLPFPLMAALEVLDANAGGLNLDIWQLFFFALLIARIAGKLELRLRTPPYAQLDGLKFLLGGLVLLGGSWFLLWSASVLKTDCTGKCWENWFQGPLMAGLAFSVISFLTAEWAASLLGACIRPVRSLFRGSVPRT